MGKIALTTEGTCGMFQARGGGSWAQRHINALFSLPARGRPACISGPSAHNHPTFRLMQAVYQPATVQYTVGSSKPSTAGDGKSSTAGDGKPSTAGDGKPSTAGSSKPSTAGDGKSSTAGDGKPSTAGDGKSSTAGDGKSSTVGNGKGSKSTT